MPVSPSSIVLLQRLRESDDSAAWQDLDGRYRSLLYNFARRSGLAEQDAEDAAQQTLIAFLSQYRAGKFDPQRGRLKNYLFGIARRQVADIFGAAAHLQEKGLGVQTGIHGIDSLPDEESWSQVFEQEWQHAIIREAFTLARRQFSDRDVRIFEMLTSEDKSADIVASELGVSPTVVYTVKSRVLKYIRTVMVRIEESW